MVTRRRSSGSRASSENARARSFGEIQGNSHRTGAPPTLSPITQPKCARPQALIASRGLRSRLPSLYLLLVGAENVIPERGGHSEIAVVEAMMHAMERPGLLQPSKWELIDPRRMLHVVKRVEV